MKYFSTAADDAHGSRGVIGDVEPPLFLPLPGMKPIRKDENKERCYANFSDKLSPIDYMEN